MSNPRGIPLCDGVVAPDAPAAGLRDPQVPSAVGNLIVCNVPSGDWAESAGLSLSLWLRLSLPVFKRDHTEPPAFGQLGADLRASAVSAADSQLWRALDTLPH